jgi:phytanoyl-CoA dioxygenase PhyH
MFANLLTSEGVAELRGFLSSEDARDLRATVHDVYSGLESAGDVGDVDLEQNFKSWDGVWLHGLPRFVWRSDPELAQRYVRILARVHASAAATLGPQWHFVSERSWFRRHKAPVRFVPWHIDADAAGLVNPTRPCLNVWLPLHAVGREVPSLDVIPGSHKYMRTQPLLEGGERYRDDAYVERIGQPRTATLEFGDALVFDSYLLHRTQLLQSDARRVSCEFRFAC